MGQRIGNGDMTGDFAAAAAEILLLDPSQVPKSRNNPGAEENEGENKRLIELEVGLHAPDMPALEAAANLPPPFPDFHQGGNGIIEDGNPQQEIHYENLGVGNMTQQFHHRYKKITIPTRNKTNALLLPA